MLLKVSHVSRNDLTAQKASQRCQVIIVSNFDFSSKTCIAMLDYQRVCWEKQNGSYDLDCAFGIVHLNPLKSQNKQLSSHAKRMNLFEATDQTRLPSGDQTWQWRILHFLTLLPLKTPCIVCSSCHVHWRVLDIEVNGMDSADASNILWWEG